MIGHQHLCMDGAAAPPRVFFYPTEVRFTVLVGEKTRLAIVAALNQVQRYPGKGDAWPSCHLGIILDRNTPKNYQKNRGLSPIPSIDLDEAVAPVNRRYHVREHRLEPLQQRLAARVPQANPHDHGTRRLEGLSDREVLVLRQNEGPSVQGVAPDRPVAGLCETAISDVARPRGPYQQSTSPAPGATAHRRESALGAPQNRVIAVPGREFQRRGNVLRF